ncbi:MAG: hypothetical protein R3B47_05670 [Bacteroidia bacterium]
MKSIDEGDKRMEAIFNTKIGSLLTRRYQLKEARDYLTKAYNIGKQYGYEKLAINSKTSISETYFGENDLEQATRFVLEVLDESEQHDMLTEHCEALALLTKIYLEAGLYESAKPIVNRELALLNEALPNTKDSVNIEYQIILAYIFKGALYYSQDSFEQAKFYFMEGQKRCGENTEYLRTHINGNLANCYDKLGDVSRAIQVGRTVIEAAKSANDPYTLSNAIGNMGEFYLSAGNVDSSVWYLERAINMANEMDNEGWASGFYETLNRAYLRMGREAEAGAALKKHMDFNLEIEKKRNKQLVDVLHGEYEAKKRRLEKQQLEEEHRSSLKVATLVILSLILALLCSLLWFFFSRRKKIQAEKASKGA